MHNPGPVSRLPLLCLLYLRYLHHYLSFKCPTSQSIAGSFRKRPWRVTGNTSSLSKQSQPSQQREDATSTKETSESGGSSYQHIDIVKLTQLIVSTRSCSLTCQQPKTRYLTTWLTITASTVPSAEWTGPNRPTLKHSSDSSEGGSTSVAVQPWMVSPSPNAITVP